MTKRSMLIAPEAALALLEQLMPDQKLNDIQKSILRYSLQGWTYPEMAREFGYNASHVRDLAYVLWQKLSEVLGEKVVKKNLAAVLWRYEMLRQVRPAPKP